MANLKNVAKVALAVNAASAAAYSAYLHVKKTNLGEVELDGKRQKVEIRGYYAEHGKIISDMVGAPRHGRPVVYFVAGIGSTAAGSFARIAQRFMTAGCRVRYVDFDPMRYDPAGVAAVILDDIQHNGYRTVKILANSMSGRVIAELQQNELEGVESYIIDPIFNGFMKPQMRVGATVLTPVLRVFNTAVGWLRYAPLPYVGWNYRSTELLADQLAPMTHWAKEPSGRWLRHLNGVVISENDWFSDHDAYIEVLEAWGIPYVVVQSDYCNTHNHWKLYADALKQLGMFDLE